jgi:DNA-binding transcriptional MocR family regulator
LDEKLESSCIRLGFAALSEEEIIHIVQMLYQALLE